MIEGALHFPAADFWNKEAEMLARYTLVEHYDNEETVTELTAEERIQLNAYRRAWYTLWILVVGIGILLWVCIICIACNKGGRVIAKPYDNIVINR